MKKALCIGIDSYKYVQDLHGCVNDANGVKAALERNGDGKEMGEKIIAVQPWGAEKTSTVVKNNADYIVGWNTNSIVNAIRGRFVVEIWLQKLLEKIKLRRMSGILPQDLDSIAQYRANIKYCD